MELHEYSDEEIKQRIRELDDFRRKLFTAGALESFYRDRYERYDEATMEIASLEKELYRRNADGRNFGIRINGVNA